MLSYYTTVIFLYFVSSGSCLKPPIKIGVVGGGIGGASAAYFIREIFPSSSIRIDVYEVEAEAGGRLSTLTINGREYESGGSVIHNRNEYMNTFRDKLGLKKRYSKYSMKLGLFDGSDFVFSGCDWDLCTLSKLFIHYGWDVMRVKQFVENMLSNFERIYEHQKNNHAFTTVEKLLSSMDESFVNMTRYTIGNTLTDAGFSNTFISQLVMAAMLDNYGQTTDISGFVGSISLAGIEPGLWSVSGGNKLIPQRLIHEAQATLINHTIVNTVTWSEQQQEFTIDSSPAVISSNEKPFTSSKPYDIVIIAVPLIKHVSNIKFKGFKQPIGNFPGAYWKTVATFVHGKINSNFFGYSESSEVFTSVMCTNPSVFFNAVSINKPVDYTETDTEIPTDRKVWKVFSREPLSKEQLQLLFTEVVEVKSVNWFAYPQYVTPEVLPPFQLATRLYYTSGIELAASAMEMSALSAKNVALLALNQWYNKLNYIDRTDVLLVNKQEL